MAGRGTGRGRRGGGCNLDANKKLYGFEDWFQSPANQIGDGGGAGHLDAGLAVDAEARLASPHRHPVHEELAPGESESESERERERERS